MKPQPSEPSEADKEREILLKQFRAWLHLAITAKQTRQDKELEAMPGPNLMTYCRALSKLPDNTLASELAAPITAILQQISKITPPCEGTLRRKDEKSVAMHDTAKRILEQIDLAFGFIQRNLNHQLRFRSEVTTDSDFLCEALYADTHAGRRVARMIRHHYQSHPEEMEDEEGGFIGDFAWDVYQRVVELDKLADEFPKQVGWAARQMNAWPVLMHRHTNNRHRFRQLADRLELGVEYPLDASEGARFRPDTPMVLYLDPLVHRLHSFVWDCAYLENSESPETDKWMAREWSKWPEELPGEDVLQILRLVGQLPPLTKATAVQWAEKTIVPLILATDASDWKNCAEPALQAIARQKGVKSRATFKSRLLSAVSATLRRLARPA
jgi:hypothetical protein